MFAFSGVVFVVGLAIVNGQVGKVCYHPKEFADRCESLYQDMLALDPYARAYRDGTSCYIYKSFFSADFVGSWQGQSFYCQQPTDQLGPGELLGGRNPERMAKILDGLQVHPDLHGYPIYVAAYQPAGGFDLSIEPDKEWYWYDGQGSEKQQKVNVIQSFRPLFGVPQPDNSDSPFSSPPLTAHAAMTVVAPLDIDGVPPPGALMDFRTSIWNPFVCEYFKCLENEFRDRQPRPNPFVPNGNGAANARTFEVLRGPNN